MERDEASIDERSRFLPAPSGPTRMRGSMRLIHGASMCSSRCTAAVRTWARVRVGLGLGLGLGFGLGLGLGFGFGLGLGLGLGFGCSHAPAAKAGLRSPRR